MVAVFRSSSSRVKAMRMSCNGCRVLRKGCSENCSIRPCLQWIKNAESQANATVFLAKFYGRAGLMSLINAGPEHLRPAIFRSLLYEACGRMVNPVFGAVGLLWSGNWAMCQAAVDSILKGCPIHPIPPESGASVQNPTEHSINNNGHNPSPLPPPPPSALMQTIAKELHKVKTKGRFKQPKRVASESKDLSLSHLIAEAEAASQVCNLRGRRCYPGELQVVAAEPPNHLVSRDYSSDSEHCDEVPRTQSAMEHKEDASPGCESDEREVELELTLCSQSPAEKHSNTFSDHSMPIIKYLGLGLRPTMSEAAC